MLRPELLRPLRQPHPPQPEIIPPPSRNKYTPAVDALTPSIHPPRAKMQVLVVLSLLSFFAQPFHAAAVFLLAGDSTTATQAANGGGTSPPPPPPPFPATLLTSAGWGDGFKNFTLAPPAFAVNYGHNGATTGSFMAGGDWAVVLAQVKKYVPSSTVYVTIQVCTVRTALRGGRRGGGGGG